MKIAAQMVNSYQSTFFRLFSNLRLLLLNLKLHASYDGGNQASSYNLQWHFQGLMIFVQALLKWILFGRQFIMHFYFMFKAQGTSIFFASSLSGVPLIQLIRLPYLIKFDLI